MDQEYITAAKVITDYISTNDFESAADESEYTRLCQEFADKFAPDKLAALDGQELLNRMVYTIDSDNGSMCYYLEFHKEIRKYFGSIAGGSSYMFGLYQSKQDATAGQWITGSPTNPEVLDFAGAVNMAKEIRKELTDANDVISQAERKGELDSVAGYIALEKKLDAILGNKNTYGWIHKYLFMLHPTLLTPWHSVDWQRHVLFAYQILPEEGTYARSGQLALIAKAAGLSAASFAQATFARFGDSVKSFYKIGTCVFDAKKVCINNFLEDKKAYIGWPEIGDLRKYDEGKGLSKDKLKSALHTATNAYNSNSKKGTATTYAGTIKQFYEMDKDCIFVAMDGHRLFALGDEIGDYVYDWNNCSCQGKMVKWHCCFADGAEMPKADEADLTTINLLKNDDNLLFLYKKYYYELNDDNRNRLMDAYPYVMEKVSDDGYKPTVGEYDPKISIEKWREILADDKIATPAVMDFFAKMMALGGASTCANLAEKFGGDASSYNGIATAFAQKVHELTECHLYKVDNDKGAYYTILFAGKYVKENGMTRFSWNLRYELWEALSKMVLPEVKPIEDIPPVEPPEVKPTKTEYSLNQILYGPPGTGKTYYTAIYAVAICDSKNIADVQKMNYADVMKRYKELKDAGRIAFTTFHQSYGYEEFIEGIKPSCDNDSGKDLEYSVEEGAFKRFCRLASTPDEFIGNIDAKIWSVKLGWHNMKDALATAVVDACMADDCIRFDWGKEQDSDYHKWLHNMNAGDYVVVRSKNNESNVVAFGQVTDDEPFYDETKDSYKWTKGVKWLLKDIDVNLQSINDGMLLNSNPLGKLNHMEVADLLKAMSEAQGEKVAAKTEPYVFIIDEINRGNISKIFGELITLIEDNKRAGRTECVEVELPYSHKRFSVSQNVYLLGTMNTADRSIAMMDTALRRRFKFVEMQPNAELLADVVVYDGGYEVNIKELLETINKRITYLYDREHTIGHAYFMKLKEEPKLSVLADIFRKSILPLLQEYFYEDYAKIQLVLGDNAKDKDDFKFVVEKDEEWDDIFLGNEEDDVDMSEKGYEINDKAFDEIKSYVKLMRK